MNLLAAPIQSVKCTAILLFYACLILSCNSKKAQETQQEKSQVQETEKSDEQPIAGAIESESIQSFENYVFQVGRAYDFLEDKCEVYPECDCCSSDLYFLSSHKFVFVAVCISGDTYYTGTYSADSTRINLTFNRRYISELLNDDYEFIKLEEKEGDSSFKSFQIEFCKGRIHLVDKSDESSAHGMRYKPDEEKKYMQGLFESMAWKRLNP